MSAARVYIDTIRSVAFGGISGTYAAIGTALAHNPRILIISNLTAGDLLFSDDGTTDKMVLKAGLVKPLYFTGSALVSDDTWVIAKGTTLYVKQITAPTSGAVYVECYYAV